MTAAVMQDPLPRAATENLTPWLPKRIKRAPSGARLFCFPYAGGGASLYQRWAATLAPDIELCAVQLPGREARLHELPFLRVQELVSSAAEQLTPFLPARYALFGHSMGALVSFELARELRRRGLPEPSALVVSAHRAPQLRDPHPPMHVLSDAEFRRVIRQLKGTPEALLANDEFMALVLPVLRTDFALCETYVYCAEPPLSCPLIALGGAGDEHITEGEVAAWRDQTSGTFELKMFAGDHFFIFEHFPEVLHLVRAALDHVP